MGIGLCKEASGHRRPNIDFLQPWDVNYRDVNEDDVESISMHAPIIERFSYNIPVKNAQSVIVRGRERGYSLRRKMGEWAKSSPDESSAEFEAKEHAEMLEDNTLYSLTQTATITKSIIQKGDDITEELARQDRQLSSASTNLHHGEHVSDQTHLYLKRMSHGFNLWSTKTPKPEVQVCINDASLRSTSINTVIRLSAIPSPRQIKSPSSKQQQIKNGINDLHLAMDVITRQQRDIAETLESQDGRLALFEDNIDRTISKIHRNMEVRNNIN
jgi:hypothetical protein